MAEHGEANWLPHWNCPNSLKFSTTVDRLSKNTLTYTQGVYLMTELVSRFLMYFLRLYMSNNQHQQASNCLCFCFIYIFLVFYFLSLHCWMLFKCHTMLYLCSAENFYCPSKLVDTLSSILAYHLDCNKKFCGLKCVCANVTCWP